MVSCSDLVYYLSLLACLILGGHCKNLNDPTTKRAYGTGLGILVTFVICGSYIVHSVLMVWGNIVIIKCCNKRMLLRLPRFCSASEMFAQNRTDGFHTIIRKKVASLVARTRASSNSILMTVSESFYSPILRHFVERMARYLHQLSLAYTWLYLIYMNYNMDIKTNYVLWIHQAIALRLVGLACEISLAEKYKSRKLKLSDSQLAKTSMELRHDSTIKKSATTFNNGDLASGPEELSPELIISYAYYFIGLHKGPYYRWKTFNEYFKTSFGMIGSCRIITEQKLKKAVVYGLSYMVLRLRFPVQVYFENDFYHSHGTDFRYLYNIPQLFLYVLQCQVVMLLCTSVCTEANFGIYPAKTQPLPGHGPSTKLSLLDLVSASEDVVLEQDYNFAMLRSFDNEKLLKGPRMKDTLKGWDMSTRYWFWAHMYKELVQSTKEVRSVVSFSAWALWCGPTIQQLVISSTMWVHLQLEHEFGKLYNTHSSMKLPWDIGFSIMRLFCLTYLTPCLILKDKAVIFHYYNSIYWVYHIVLIILILTAVGVQKQRIMSRRAAAD